MPDAAISPAEMRGSEGGGGSLNRRGAEVRDDERAVLAKPGRLPIRVLLSGGAYI